MNTLRRIFQLTILTIVFMVVSGASYFFIDLCSGGRLERWQSAEFTGSVGEESLAIELATLPVVLAVLACWGVVRLFRLRSVRNEIDDTFRPILTAVVGYGRFVLVVIAILYLVLGHGWAAAAHLVVAVLMFALFYRYHRAQERTTQEQLLLERGDKEDESPKDVA